jgi:hypothetical protein
MSVGLGTTTVVELDEPRVVVDVESVVVGAGTVVVVVVNPLFQSQQLLNRGFRCAENTRTKGLRRFQLLFPWRWEWERPVT